MKRVIVTALVGAALVPATTAEGHGRYRHCGGYWEHNLSGNVHVRHTTCKVGRRVARAWTGRRVEYIRGFRCVFRSLGHEAGRIGCRRGRARVVFYTGA
jgi:hypothetical protein